MTGLAGRRRRRCDVGMQVASDVRMGVRGSQDAGDAVSPYAQGESLAFFSRCTAWRVVVGAGGLAGSHMSCFLSWWEESLIELGVDVGWVLGAVAGLAHV
jgi:hypothetical protein